MNKRQSFALGAVIFSLLIPGAYLGAVNDPNIRSAWQISAINAHKFWKYTLGKKATTIAIVDSGFQFDLEEVNVNFVPNRKDPINGRDDDGNGYVDDYYGWDFIHNDNVPDDKSMHGTWMASLAAGALNNNQFAAGICPNCGVVPVRFLNWEGLGDSEDAVKGIYYAISRGVKVINLSFAGEGIDRDMERALLAAGRADIVVVVSAGNDGEEVGRDNIYPAKFNMPHLIKVAAAGPDHKLWQDSNYGLNYVDVAAPGVDVIGVWEGKIDHGSGTSNASSITAGAVGLLRTQYPQLTAPQIKKLLMSSCTRSQYLEKKVICGGMFDLGKLVPKEQ